jgi:hypothetical protein
MSGAVHAPGSLPLRHLYTDLYNNIIDYFEEKGLDFWASGGSKYMLEGIGGQTQFIKITLHEMTPKMFEEVILPQLEQLAKNENYKVEWARDGKLEVYDVKVKPCL